MKNQSMASYKLAGLVLAGGEGRRLGGRDKGMVFWRSRPMAEWVFDTLSAIVQPVLVSANRSLTDYQKFAPGRVYEDTPNLYGQGPLAGLLTGLKEARKLGADAVLVSPCDTPEITPDIYAHLLQTWKKNPARPVIAECEGRVHPLHGVYPVTCASQLEGQLMGGNRRVMVFAEMVGAVRVACEDSPRAFRNRNCPEDF
jgi:molybdopterin-guanine dinucleotide biosynthesis protein A